jgi:hypothetical protein
MLQYNISVTGPFITWLYILDYIIHYDTQARERKNMGGGSSSWPAALPPY